MNALGAAILFIILAVVVSAPEGDDNFAVAGVRDCVRAARPVFARLGVGENLVATYPDCGHDFPPAAREAAYRVMDRVLRPVSPTR